MDLVKYLEAGSHGLLNILLYTLNSKEYSLVYRENYLQNYLPKIY